MLVTAAAATMLAGYRRHYIKHFIQEKNSYITDKGRIQHIRKTHPQINSCIVDKGEGFNTSQINPSTNRFVHHRQRSKVEQKKLIYTGGDTGAPEKGDCQGDTVRLPPPSLAGERGCLLLLRRAHPSSPPARRPSPLPLSLRRCGRGGRIRRRGSRIRWRGGRVWAPPRPHRWIRERARRRRRGRRRRAAAVALSPRRRSSPSTLAAGLQEMNCSRRYACAVCAVGVSMNVGGPCRPNVFTYRLLASLCLRS